KTNTTNQAVNTYNSVTSMRLDDKIDAIEDFIGEILHNMAMLCAANMEQQQVAEIIGDKLAMDWQRYAPRELAARFNMRVVGGSTQKPTSSTKKQEAMTLGQVLGQFASASPKALVVFLQVLRNAFDDTLIREDDWNSIIESIGQTPSAGGGSSPAAGAPPGGVAAPTAPSGGDPMMQMMTQLEQLPPQLLAAFGSLLQQGMKPTEALQAIGQAMQNPQGQVQ
ncbi:MAG: hypothetical protein AB7V46_24765, partial [Thermomicrobiales bacterium]